MEENQSQAQLGQNIAAPTQTPQQPEGAVSSYPPPKNKMGNTYLLIALLLFTVVLVLIVYISVVNKQSNVPPNVPPAGQFRAPPSPTATIAPRQTDEDEELNSIDIGDLDADFKDVEADLGGF